MSCNVQVLCEIPIMFGSTKLAQSRHCIMKCLYKARKVSIYVHGGIDIDSLSTIFPIGFWNCSDSLVFQNCSDSLIFWNCSDSLVFLFFTLILTIERISTLYIKQFKHKSQIVAQNLVYHAYHIHYILLHLLIQHPMDSSVQQSQSNGYMYMLSIEHYLVSSSIHYTTNLYY